MHNRFTKKGTDKFHMHWKRLIDFNVKKMLFGIKQD